MLISPADELAGKGLESSLFDYLPSASRIFFDEPREFYAALERQSRRYREFIKAARQEDAARPALALLDRAQLETGLAQHTVIFHSFFPANPAQTQAGLYAHISQIEMEPFYKRHDGLFTRLQEWLDHDYTVRLAVKPAARGKN